MSNSTSSWIMAKLVLFLTNREGCKRQEEPETHGLVSSVIVTDAFGYQYEIRVRTLGRVTVDHKEGTDECSR